MQEITKEDRLGKRKNWRKRIIKMTLFVILYKLIFGTINIQWPIGNQYNRWYTVTIDDTPITVETIEETTIPIIPFFVNWKMYNMETFYNVKEYEITHQIDLNENSELKIEINTNAIS